MGAHPASSSAIHVLQAAIVLLQSLLPLSVLRAPTVPLAPPPRLYVLRERNAQRQAARLCCRRASPVLWGLIVVWAPSHPRPALRAGASVPLEALPFQIAFCALLGPHVRGLEVPQCSVPLARFSPQRALRSAKRATVAPTMRPLWVAHRCVHRVPPISTVFRPLSKPRVPPTHARHPEPRHSWAADAPLASPAPTPSASPPPFASTRPRLILTLTSVAFALLLLMRLPRRRASLLRRLLSAVFRIALARVAFFRTWTTWRL